MELRNCFDDPNSIPWHPEQPSWPPLPDATPLASGNPNDAASSSSIAIQAVEPQVVQENGLPNMHLKKIFIYRHGP